jgi:cytochrome c oxidase subunit 2
MDTPILNLLAEVQGPSLWFPTDASSSNQVDPLAYFIIWVCAFFLVFNAGLMVFFAIRYRQKKKAGAATGQTHNTALEVTWSVIPAFILAIIFIWGFRGFLHQSTPPDDAYDILVVGYQWGWQFHYPNGHSAKGWQKEGEEFPDPIALHVPADRPVRLTLQSNDVIHSVSIPQMRVKKDCVPGRLNQMWFEAKWDPKEAKTRTMPTKAGGTVEVQYNEYDLFCTEYCGQDHSTMITKVYVYKPGGDFEKWLEGDSLTDPLKPLWEVGQGIWATQCKSCHSVEGQAGTGPAWNDLIGDPNHATNVGDIEADEAYIRESIVNPGAKLAKGYPNAMASFASLDPREIAGLIEYMKTISKHYPDYKKDAEQTPRWGDLNPDGTPIDAGDGEGESPAGDDAQPEQDAEPVADAQG